MGLIKNKKCPFFNQFILQIFGGDFANLWGIFASALGDFCKNWGIFCKIGGFFLKLGDFEPKLGDFRIFCFFCENFDFS